MTTTPTMAAGSARNVSCPFIRPSRKLNVNSALLNSEEWSVARSHGNPHAPSPDGWGLNQRPLWVLRSDQIEHCQQSAEAKLPGLEYGKITRESRHKTVSFQSSLGAY